MSVFTNALDNIRIASPCSQDWNEMSGDERARFCGECKLNVYNLSGMSRSEAENLIFQAEGNRLCVRFFRRSDGTILTKDCPVGWQAIKRNVSKTATAFTSLVFAALGAIGFTNFLTRLNQSEIGAIAVENSRTDRISIENTNTDRAEKPIATMGKIAIEQKGEVGEATVGQMVLTEDAARRSQRKAKRKAINR